jgi:hypothetical protein
MDSIWTHLSSNYQINVRVGCKQQHSRKYCGAEENEHQVIWVNQILEVTGRIR